MPAQPVIAIERIVYHRERAAGMYAAMPYALAQGDVEVPYLVVQTLLWCVITYWMFGFEASAGGVTLHSACFVCYAPYFWSLDK